jgi:carbamoyl-phosphate synthase large subunit
LGDEVKILFTGGGGAATNAWAHLLEDHSLAFADMNEAAIPRFPVYFPARDRSAYAIPRADAPEFVVALAELCHRKAVHLLVPGVDEELIQIAEARETFPCPVLLPHAELIARHLDKWESMSRLSRGVRVPRMWGCWASSDDLCFPCVIKPRRGRGSRHIAVVESLAELAAYMSMCHLSPFDLMLQERIVGQEYTVTVVADQAKRLRAIVPVRVDDKRGVTIRGQAVPDEAVTDVCRRIHAADPFSGVINVQGIKTVEGQFIPFEINPRISTTTCLAVAAGVDVFALAMEPELAPFTSMSLRRHWHTEFVS